MDKRVKSVWIIFWKKMIYIMMCVGEGLGYRWPCLTNNWCTMLCVCCREMSKPCKKLGAWHRIRYLSKIENYLHRNSLGWHLSLKRKAKGLCVLCVYWHVIVMATGLSFAWTWMDQIRDGGRQRTEAELGKCIVLFLTLFKICVPMWGILSRCLLQI